MIVRNMHPLLIFDCFKYQNDRIGELWLGLRRCMFVCAWFTFLLASTIAL